MHEPDEQFKGFGWIDVLPAQQMWHAFTRSSASCLMQMVKNKLVNLLTSFSCVTQAEMYNLRTGVNYTRPHDDFTPTGDEDRQQLVGRGRIIVMPSRTITLLKNRAIFSKIRRCHSFLMNARSVYTKKDRKSPPQPPPGRGGGGVGFIDIIHQVIR
ncbi:MAG: hypothetical protein IJU76_13260 [Desulfovibrionaceae bacterium]|nr:hypothetical protein [Desulfovibrionaceae bacterium]